MTIRMQLRLTCARTPISAPFAHFLASKRSRETFDGERERSPLNNRAPLRASALKARLREARSRTSEACDSSIPSVPVENALGHVVKKEYLSNHDSTPGSGTHNSFTQPESFVDPTRAAEFLSIRPRKLLELARAKILPGHPIGGGRRHVWRFRLSELAASVTREVDSRPAVPNGQKARKR